ncbi:MAG: hypothetical protein U0457_00100 [Candidatus Sericytochromatia bacterium]
MKIYTTIKQKEPEKLTFSTIYNEYTIAKNAEDIMNKGCNYSFDIGYSFCE